MNTYVLAIGINDLKLPALPPVGQNEEKELGN
jgi:hypothetical protein